MPDINIVKTDSRGRITLPPPFRSERLFEYVVEGEQITLYPVRTVRKYPDMSDLPTAHLETAWVRKEDRVNEDSRQGISAPSPSDALQRIRK